MSIRRSPPRPTPTRAPTWPTPVPPTSTSVGTSARSATRPRPTTGTSPAWRSIRQPAEPSRQAGLDRPSGQAEGREEWVVGGDDRVAVGALVEFVLEGSGDPHRPHAGGPGAGHVGAPPVADMGAAGRVRVAETGQGVLEDPAVGLVDADFVGERPVVEVSKDPVALKMAKERRRWRETHVADDPEPHAPVG